MNSTAVRPCPVCGSHDADQLHRQRFVVPEARRYADYVYAPFQDFNTEHINHFSGQSLDNAMTGQGCSAVIGGDRLLDASPDTFTPAIYRIYKQTGAAGSITPDPLHHREIATQIQALGLPNRVILQPEAQPKLHEEVSA